MIFVHACLFPFKLTFHIRTVPTRMTEWIYQASTHWEKCSRTDEFNHTDFNDHPGSECRSTHLSWVLLSKLKIIGWLQFKNSFYCSFSCDKLLWSHTEKNKTIIHAQHFQPGGEKQTDNHILIKTLKKEKKHECKVWWIVVDHNFFLNIKKKKKKCCSG